MHLKISVLGPMQVWLDENRVNQFEFERVRALLLYIFVEADRQHDRAVLASKLWPDASLKTGLQNLRQTLAALKRALKEKQQATPFLLTTSSTIGVNPESDFSIDLHAFSKLIKEVETHTHRRLGICSTCMTRLEAASQLYRGDFASDVRVDSQFFEEWLLLKQEQTHIQVMHALAKLTDYFLRHHQFAKALQTARKQLALYPLCEIAHHQLIQALAADGRRHAALKHCESYKALLAKELMISLPIKTADLHSKLISETWDPATVCPASQHNLPKPINPFIGYEKELSLIHECLSKSENRLITLTGIVGSGKSRTAIEAAWNEAANFRDGVYYIDLEDVQPHRVLATVAAHLLPELPLEDRLNRHLVANLREKELLLILDHFDHLVASDAPTIRMLLREVPGFHILVTSQTLLRLKGEKYLEIKGLDFDTDGDENTFFTTPAIRFFIQSVKIWRPDFNLETAETRQAVLKICRLSNGNPRALELFAYGINFVPLNHISPDNENITMAGELLSRDVPQRQRSVQEMFDDSWSCLLDEEKDLLVSLSVFESTFNLTAAQEIALASPAMLLSLHAKSWLQLHAPPKIHEEQSHECQQRSLICSFQIPKLFRGRVIKFLKQDSSRFYNLQMGHAVFYMNFLRQSMDNLLIGGNQAWILPVVTQELSNIQQAWKWAGKQQINDLATQIEHDLSLYYLINNRRLRPARSKLTTSKTTAESSQMFEAALYRYVAAGD